MNICCFYDVWGFGPYYNDGSKDIYCNKIDYHISGTVWIDNHYSLVSHFELYYIQ